ncbi:MAG: metallophosphoesterase [Candidatus Odinarchaeota archaeon]
MEFLVLSDIHDNWLHLDTILDIVHEVNGVIFLGDLMQHSEHSDVSPESQENFKKIYDAAKWMVAIPGNGAVPKVVHFMDSLGINLHGASKQIGEISFFGVGGVTDPVGVVLNLREFFQSERYAAIELDSKSIETLNVFGVFIRNGFFEVEDWFPEKIDEIEKYRSPFEHTEDEVFEILLRGYETIRNSPVKVLLSHVPPYEAGLNPVLPEGVSTGSKAITRFILEFHPTLVLSGHYHRDYKFTIGSVPCAIVPAVKDGFCSILHFESKDKQFRIKSRRF